MINVCTATHVTALAANRGGYQETAVRIIIAFGNRVLRVSILIECFDVRSIDKGKTRAILFHERRAFEKLYEK